MRLFARADKPSLNSGSSRAERETRLKRIFRSDRLKRNRARSTDYTQLIATAEDSIRGGKIHDARKLIASLKLRALPREHAFAVANIARRTGQPQKTLEILWPLVRPSRPLRVHPTSDEMGEYAVALLALGSHQEAARILEEASKTAPALNLYLGFAHMTQWNYPEAIPCFERFLAIEDLPPYKSLIGRVNLAAALVALGNSAKAWPLLDEIISTAKPNGWLLFYKNGLELSAQLAAFEQNWENAKSFLSRIDEDASLTKNDLFIRKWRSLIELYESNGSRKSLDHLARVRKDAAELGHWETVRDCDFHRALVTKNESLYQRVYFGTPFRSYRARMAEKAKGWMELPTNYVWSPDGRKPSRTFDLENGNETQSPVKIKPGKALHRALRILTSDFYRPLPLGSLHARLFHDEHFNPETGTLRVHKVVSRLRDWLRKNKIPVDIVTTDSGFRMESDDTYGFLISLRENEAPLDRADFQIMLTRLKRLWADLGFSSTQAAAQLEISERLARDILRWGTERGLLSRAGSGRATRYKFA